VPFRTFRFLGAIMIVAGLQSGWVPARALAIAPAEALRPE
jgi:hypothetical protein